MVSRESKFDNPVVKELILFYWLRWLEFSVDCNNNKFEFKLV
jgi:hypothetical protein